MLSVVENSRSARIYSGTIDVNCPRGFYIGNWVQNGNRGSGMIDEKYEINYFFYMNRNDAIAKLRTEEQQTRIVKKPKQEQKQNIFGQKNL